MSLIHEYSKLEQHVMIAKCPRSCGLCRAECERVEPDARADSEAGGVEEVAPASVEPSGAEVGEL